MPSAVPSSTHKTLTSYLTKLPQHLPDPSPPPTSWFFSSTPPTSAISLAHAARGQNLLKLHTKLAARVTDCNTSPLQDAHAIQTFLTILSVCAGKEEEEEEEESYTLATTSPTSAEITPLPHFDQTQTPQTTPFSPPPFYSSPEQTAPTFDLSQALALTLDTAQKLLAHSSYDGLWSNGAPLLSTATSLVCSVSLSSPNIELCMIRYLLTATCRPHISDRFALRETHLLQAVRIVYNVFLCTTDKANRVTARATLEQMIASVFERMEVWEKHNPNPGASNEATTAGDGVQQQAGARRGSLYDNVYSNLGFSPPPSPSLPPAPPPIPPPLLSSTHDPITPAPGAADFASPNHRDAFLVFRSLCKLSMKSIPDQADLGYTYTELSTPTKPLPPSEHLVTTGDAPQDFSSGSTPTAPLSASPASGSPALESKVLALELLLSTLNNAGAALITGDRFSFAIRHYLCVSLLKNCTSNVTKIISLSLRLFVPIILHFRDNLKSEIEVFITNIFFVILDSPNSSPDHKSLVINLFEQICADPATLAEIFLNYDCDLSAVDLFHRIVAALARSAKTELTSDIKGVFQGSTKLAVIKRATATLRLDAMNALVQVLTSLHQSLDHQSLDPNPDSPSAQEGVAPPTPSSDDADSNLVQLYDSKKKLQEQQQEGVLRFNQNPKKGVKFLGSVNLLDATSPESVARYLLENKESLDKAVIGDYLGRGVEEQNGFCFAVLQCYVDQLDFTRMVFDDAIRHFLAGFRLPGEAQKIDRMMEKFAERFSLQNPEVFTSPDVAFILAFSIIMLNTDLHNPNLKEDRRMNKDGFIRNNRGIGEGGADMPRELLEGIFDRIQKNQISLKEDDAARSKMGGDGEAATGSTLTSLFSDGGAEFDKTRHAEFIKERDDMVRKTEHFFKQKRKPRQEGASSFVRTSTSGLKDEYVLPMFEVTWAPALSVFSIAMESANGLDKLVENEKEAMEQIAHSAIDACLRGFRLGVMIAGRCNLDIARDTYINALSNFAQLGSGRILEPRNVMCIVELLDIALEDGEVLGSTWEHIFKVCSEVSRLKQVYERIRSDDGFVAQVEESLYNGGTEVEDDEAGDLSELAVNEQNASIINEYVTDETLDCIYQQSAHLSVAGVGDFVLQLCRVSRMEISGYGGGVGSEENAVSMDAAHDINSTKNLFSRRAFFGGGGVSVASKIIGHQPVIHSLQKLVEVAHYNMDNRGRVAWDDLWGVMSAHFSSTALHTNAAVAMYAVDSLRQLSIKFLQKEELRHFQGQHKFLRPYVEIMEKSTQSTTREMLVECVKQICMLNETGKVVLKSGWRAVIGVLRFGRSKECFEMIVKLLQQLVEGGGGDNMEAYFVDLTDALVEYMSSGDQELALQSTVWVRSLADWLSRQNADDLGVGVVIDVGDKTWALWSPIFNGLAGIVASITVSSEVRSDALDVLCDIVKAYHVEEGGGDVLRLVFRNCFEPIFDKVRVESGAPLAVPDNFVFYLSSDKESGKEEGGREDWLNGTFDEIVDAFTGIYEVAPNSLLEVISVFASGINSPSAAIATKSLRRLTEFVLKVSPEEELVKDMWRTCAEILMVCIGNTVRERNNMVYVCIFCIEQIGVLMTSVDGMPKAIALQMLSSIVDAVETLEAVGGAGGEGGAGGGVHPREIALFARGWMVRILLKLAGDVQVEVGAAKNETQDVLTHITRSLLTGYIEKDAEGGGGAEHVKLTELVCELLEGYEKFEDALLLANMGWLFPMLSSLIQCSNKKVRVLVHKIVSRLFSGPLSELLKSSEIAAAASKEEETV